MELGSEIVRYVIGLLNECSPDSESLRDSETVSRTTTSFKKVPSESVDETALSTIGGWISPAHCTLLEPRCRRCDAGSTKEEAAIYTSIKRSVVDTQARLSTF